MIDLMKNKIRSIFTSGQVKLGSQVHKPKKGPGSYKRINRADQE